MARRRGGVKKNDKGKNGGVKGKLTPKERRAKAPWVMAMRALKGILDRDGGDAETKKELLAIQRHLKRVEPAVKTALEEAEEAGGEMDGFYGEGTDCAGYLVCVAKDAMGMADEDDWEEIDSAEAEEAEEAGEQDAEESGGDGSDSSDSDGSD